MSNWKRRKNYNGKNKKYSIIQYLRNKKKSSRDFEIMLSNLSLEEIIALKLELSTTTVANRLYGIPLWKNLQNIVQDAILKYAFSATRTKQEAMRFLGLKESHFHQLVKKYKPSDYFLDKEEE
tara:strand:+ start:1149 stop:1517 length:369 start_codon:yes stop_codon:yes gene_type:complete